MEAPKRYHPVLVTLHWLIVLLVFTNLYLGLFIFEPLLRGGGAFRIPDLHWRSIWRLGSRSLF